MERETVQCFFLYNIYFLKKSLSQSHSQIIVIKYLNGIFNVNICLTFIIIIRKCLFYIIFDVVNDFFLQFMHICH